MGILLSGDNFETIRLACVGCQSCLRKGGEKALLKNIGTPELMILALVVFFLVGGKKLPELARGVGQSIRELKSAAKEEV